jgi:type IVB pilus formation R64 PilN family outer membrane protein
MRILLKLSTLALTAIGTLTLSACAPTLQVKTERDFADTAALVEANMRKSRAAAVDEITKRENEQEVRRPYVAGRSIPLARESQMPEQLRKSVPVTAFFSNTSVGLAVALNQVSASTGMSIVAMPDALMPASVFSPKIATATAQITAPPMVNLRASGTPVWKLLDDIASQVQAHWRPTPTGAEFYRVETKSYELMVGPQTAATSASLGKGGNGNNAFSSDSKTSYDMKAANPMDGIKAIVDSMLSTGGKLHLANDSQILLVTDTPEIHARVEEFVRKQNKSMSRRVRMVVEAIEVVAKDSAEFGFDWNLAYNTTTQALSIGSPPSLAGQQSGVLNLQQTVGPFSGSSLVIQALNEIGTVVNRRIFPFVTTSGRPITQALRTTFNYVDQVQTTSVASSTNSIVQAPTVTQKDETVGTFLTLVPTVKADGTVFVSIAYDVTTADPLRPYTVGTGASQVTVQQKTINGAGTIQEVPIRSGRTEIIGGIELTSSQATSRRLGDGIPIIAGGSNLQSRTKAVTVLLVTATVEEGI